MALCGTSHRTIITFTNNISGLLLGQAALGPSKYAFFASGGGRTRFGVSIKQICNVSVTVHSEVFNRLCGCDMERSCEKTFFTEWMDSD